MDSAEIRKKYLEFFKARGHAIVPSSPLVPENDPTTLFTSSGMQPLITYLLGQAHPEGKRVADSQKCFRADDIDEVGDNRHTTFFEMLGNWSFGDYFKREQLPWVFEFLTKELKIDPKNLYVTVFAGDAETGVPADDESVEIWKALFREKGITAEYVKLGSEENGGKAGMQGGRIFSYDVKKNWWSRAGVPSNMPPGEPGGPDSEIFYDFGTEHDPKFGKHCHPNCDCGRFLEIGNSVFMEYKKNDDGSFSKLAQRNVDFGGGLERIAAAANSNPDVFEIDVFKRMREALPALSVPPSSARIILDHLRASIFLVNDGVLPGNKGRGYLVRRLLRRAAFKSGDFAAREAREAGKGATALMATKGEWVPAVVDVVCSLYGDVYENLRPNREKTIGAIIDEFDKFSELIPGGIRELNKRLEAGSISGKDAFDLYQSYGFPWELTEEIAKGKGASVDRKEFEAEFEKHRELSRTASAGAFKGGLADHSEKTTRLHTAHHLLLKALQVVLGPDVKQRGSNITSERLRMDFSYDGKMTDEQKKEAERIVNEKIAEDLPVIRSEMPREKAEKLGAEHEFGQKYPERVSVYSVGPKSATAENPRFEEAFSIEFCGGPHVAHTGEIGKFKILKEEAVGAGVRRIRGVVE